MSQFTITGWVNVTSIPGGSGWAAAALAASDGWGAGCIVAEFIGTGGGGNAGLLQWSINNSFEMYSKTKFDSASGNQNQWVHVALVYDAVGMTAKIYINGVLDNSAGTSSQAADLSALKISSWGGGDRFFNGKIDDLRIYNRVLSPTEISYFMPPDTSPPTPTTSTWLINPTAASDTSITMSATKVTDLNGVEYHFDCTAGTGGHDSGWITTNQYTDSGLTASTQYTYTVQTRDGLGNIGTVSASRSATTNATDTSAPTPNPATFAVAPKGDTTTSITMTATKGTDADSLIEYNFVRVTGSSGPASSGWQASPTWTATGLTPGATCTYSVQMRDGKGNTGTVSATSATATARDDTAPTLPGAKYAPMTMPWRTRPLVKPDGTLFMTARDATDPSGVQYYFHCSSGGGPDSGWQDSSHYTSAAVADGTYTYQVKVRDKSAQYNETPYTGDESFTVSTKNVWHSKTISQLSALPDDDLVTFTGTVTAVASTYYTVTDSGYSIKVMPNTTDSATDGTLLNRIVTVHGCMWTYTALGRTVVYSQVDRQLNTYTITASAGANGSINPSGSVQVTELTDQTFNITPNSGYTVDTLTVDSVPQTPALSYTFYSVTANHTISVTFKVDPNPTQRAYYRFDETSGTTAVDSSGHGNNGTINAGCSWVAGHINNALNFNGTSGSMTVPNLGASFTGFSIVGWINVTALPAGAGWQAASLASSDNWGSGAVAMLLLGPNSGTHAGQIQLSVNGAPGGDLVWSATNFGNYLGTWVHVAATYSTTGAKIYVNGVPDGTATFSDQPDR